MLSTQAFGSRIIYKKASKLTYRSSLTRYRATVEDHGKNFGSKITTSFSRVVHYIHLLSFCWDCCNTAPIKSHQDGAVSTRQLQSKNHSVRLAAQVDFRPFSKLHQS